MKNKKPIAEFYFHCKPTAKKGEQTEEVLLLRNSFSPCHQRPTQGTLTDSKAAV